MMLMYACARVALNVQLVKSSAFAHLVNSASRETKIN